MASGFMTSTTLMPALPNGTDHQNVTQSQWTSVDSTLLSLQTTAQKTMQTTNTLPDTMSAAATAGHVTTLGSRHGTTDISVGISTSLIGGLSAVAVLVLGIVALVVWFILKRNKCSIVQNDASAVEKRSGRHRTTWHDGNNSRISDDIGVNMHDIDLQPAHIFNNHGAIHSVTGIDNVSMVPESGSGVQGSDDASEDEDNVYSTANDVDDAIEHTSKDSEDRSGNVNIIILNKAADSNPNGVKETVMFDGRNNTFKIKDNSNVATKQEHYEIERYGETGRQYTTMCRSTRKENSPLDTDEGSANADINNTISDGATYNETRHDNDERSLQISSKFQVCDETDDEYIEMKAVIEGDSDENNAHLSDFGQDNELVEEDIYVNHEQIGEIAHKDDYSWLGEEEEVDNNKGTRGQAGPVPGPRRVQSEIVVSGVKAPVAQPRLSLKRNADPYDYPPTPRRFMDNNSTMISGTNNGLHSVHETVSELSTSGVQDSKVENGKEQTEEDDVYSFPNIEGGESLKTIEDYDEDIVYDVPRFRRSSIESD